MKNNKLFFKIYIPLLIIISSAAIVFSVLGNKPRIGYLSEFKFDISHINRTLELNNLSYIKELFTKDRILDEEGIKNYIFTNESITNYSYGFKVQYYDKVFRHSDIYNVYIDTNKVLKDNDFIEKNKDYFNQPFFKNDVSYKSGSTLQNIDTSLNRYKVLNTANKYIDLINKKAGQILTKLAYIKTRANNDNNTENERRKLAADYIVYYNTIMECYQLTYHDEISNTDKGFKNKSLINIIKYSKGPSIKARSSEIWGIIKTYLRGKICHITGEPYESIDIGFWSKPSFEIKTLGNSVRLALKNIYNPNMDPELVKNELNKINGTIFVIFDDNISGGATLSDICYQCDQLGIKNIVPITFGVMNEKWTLGRMPLTIPSEKDSENRAKFNY